MNSQFNPLYPLSRVKKVKPKSQNNSKQNSKKTLISNIRKKSTDNIKQSLHQLKEEMKDLGMIDGDLDTLHLQYSNEHLLSDPNLPSLPSSDPKGSKVDNTQSQTQNHHHQNNQPEVIDPFHVDYFYDKTQFISQMDIANDFLIVKGANNKDVKQNNNNSHMNLQNNYQKSPKETLNKQKPRKENQNESNNSFQSKQRVTSPHDESPQTVSKKLAQNPTTYEKLRNFFIKRMKEDHSKQTNDQNIFDNIEENQLKSKKTLIKNHTGIDAFNRTLTAQMMNHNMSSIPNRNNIYSSQQPRRNQSSDEKYRYQAERNPSLSKIRTVDQLAQEVFVSNDATIAAHNLKNPRTTKLYPSRERVDKLLNINSTQIYDYPISKSFNTSKFYKKIKKISNKNEFSTIDIYDDKLHDEVQMLNNDSDFLIPNTLNESSKDIIFRVHQNVYETKLNEETNLKSESDVIGIEFGSEILLTDPGVEVNKSNPTKSMNSKNSIIKLNKNVSKKDNRTKLEHYDAMKTHQAEYINNTNHELLNFRNRQERNIFSYAKRKQLEKRKNDFVDYTHLPQTIDHDVRMQLKQLKHTVLPSNSQIINQEDDDLNQMFEYFYENNIINKNNIMVKEEDLCKKVDKMMDMLKLQTNI